MELKDECKAIGTSARFELHTERTNCGLRMRLLLLISFISTALCGNCSWEQCNPWSEDDNVLKVHLIPHTHDDLGWIKTVDQYYYGTKPDLVPVGVQYIYNTVIDELEKHPSRKFSFAETGFLHRWVRSHGDSEKHRLQKLVKTGQIEMIGGGWVQNDEASAHYVDIIDQMTLGLHHLELLFGECGKPQVAWQIDPFGHSKEMANLFAMMGYSSLFFARMHYLEKQVRLQNKSLEFIWNSSDDLKTQILTGQFFQDNYGPPPGFCWDALCGDDPMQDNPDLDEYNVDEKVFEFVKHVRNQSTFQRTKHVMLLMGSDFQYTNANTWFENMDKLIKYVNANKSLNVDVFYSTPACYVNALTESRPHLPTKQDDFFPYASSEHSFWTGYFSSRPGLKLMIRKASAYQQLAKQLDAQFFLKPHPESSDVEVMKRASALAQHHDAVTGTAKENVTRDYEKRLHTGMAELQEVINDALATQSYRGAYPKYQMCHLINETVCEIPRNLATFSLNVFNGQGQKRNSIVRVPYYSRTAIVKNDKDEIVDVQLTKTFQVPTIADPSTAPYELFIPVEVDPLGFRTYFINNSSSVRATTFVQPKKIKKDDTQNVTIENENFALNFDADGFLSTVTDKKSGKINKFRQEFFFYEGVDRNSSQPSGAYVFRPKSAEALAFAKPSKLEVTKGALVQEVRQTITPWIYQTIRLYANRSHIEFDWIVGPLPKEKVNPISKEIVTRYTTDIDSKGVFYTDANGRQMMKRKLKHHPSFEYQDTEPVSGNYYPVTNRAFVRDANRQLTVLPDRAQGVTGGNGHLEFMIHRRCFADDHWGVEEALDEPGKDGQGLVVRGKHWVVLSEAKDAATIHRPLAVELFNEPVLLFAQMQNITKYRTNFITKYSGLTRELPPFVNLLTLERKSGEKILLRLEHIFQNLEDEANSKPMNIDIRDLFTKFTITEMKPLSLGANRNATATSTGRSGRYSDFVINLKPQDIQTFELTVTEKKQNMDGSYVQ